MPLRYNLFYAYKKSKISKHVHSTAVNCVIVCLLLQQLSLMMFSITRSGKEEDGNSKFLSVRAVFSISVFAISIFLFVLQVKIFVDLCPMAFFTCISFPSRYSLVVSWTFRPSSMSTGDLHLKVTHLRRQECRGKFWQNLVG